MEIVEIEPIPDGRFFVSIVGRRRCLVLNLEDQDGQGCTNALVFLCVSIIFRLDGNTRLRVSDSWFVSQRQHPSPVGINVPPNCSPRYGDRI